MPGDPSYGKHLQLKDQEAGRAEFRSRVAEDSADTSAADEAYAGRFNDFWSLPDGLRGEAERLSYDIHRSETLIAERNHAVHVANEVQQRKTLDVAEFGSSGAEAPVSLGSAGESGVGSLRVPQNLNLRLERELEAGIRDIWSDNDVYGFAHAATDEIERAQQAPPEEGGEQAQSGEGEGEESEFTVDTLAFSSAQRDVVAAVDALQNAMGAVGGAEDIPGAVNRSAMRAADSSETGMTQQIDVTNLMASTFYDMTITCLRIGTAMASICHGLEAELTNYEEADAAVVETFSA